MESNKEMEWPHQLELNSKRINEINLNLNEADWWGSNSISFSMKLLGAPQQQLNLSSTPINHQLNTNQKSLVLLIGLVELVELIERN